MKARLFLLFISMSTIVHASDFRYIFGDDYDDALNFLKENKDMIFKSSEEYNNDAGVVISIVFPELIRYSLVRDFLETNALEFLYINGGKNAADFSIGSFQMKPSFIENLENQIRKAKNLRSKYHDVNDFQTLNPLEIRAERVKRLKSLEWQILYANCFFDLLTTRFPEIRKKPKSQQIQILSTAYNCGKYNSIDEIINCSKNKYFPYGVKFKGEQYAYCDIAVNFYNKYSKLYFNYWNSKSTK